MWPEIFTISRNTFGETLIVSKFVVHLCFLPIELPCFAYFFFSFIRFNLISLNVLFAFKTYNTGNYNCQLQWIIFYLNLQVHLFPLSEGLGKRSGLVGVCNMKFGNPLASGGQSSPKSTSTLFASSHMPKKGILTRIYFARGQVPDCLE